jgi:hypothetical protein
MLLTMLPPMLLLIATLNFWTKTSGTWINVFTILGGTSIGILGRNQLSNTIQQVITQGLGLFTLFLGMTMASSMLKVQAGRADGVILALLAIVLGGVLGEMLRLEMRLQRVGDWLKDRFRGGGRFTEGFVAASLLFGVGPMAIVGCLNNGLSGNNELLTVKAIMDGLASIAFSSIYGMGVGFSALPILIYQGGLSLAAGTLATTLSDPANDPQVLLVSGVGGLMVLGIGINLLEIQKIRVSSFLPALVIVLLLFRLAQWRQ